MNDDIYKSFDEWKKDTLSWLERLLGGCSSTDEYLDFLNKTALRQELLTTQILSVLQAMANIYIPGIPTLPPITIRRSPQAKQQILTERASLDTTPFNSDYMADCRTAIRGTLKVESTLNQACEVYLVGHVLNTPNNAVTIGITEICPANDSIGLGWSVGCWYPFIGAVFTPQVAPTSGLISAVMQNQE